MAEADPTVMIKTINNEINDATTELLTVLDMYDPDSYPPQVLQETKLDWIKDVRIQYGRVFKSYMELEKLKDHMSPEEFEVRIHTLCQRNRVHYLV